MNRLLLVLISIGLTIGWAQAQRIPTLPGQTARPNSSTASTGQQSGGAIIDDSTRQIYGPTTTRYFLESDVLNNRKTLYTLDTLLEGIHQFNFVNRANNTYIDLGNLGTAMRPVFYETPRVGAQAGFNAYTPYGYPEQTMPYFNTRSPYTDMYVALGGRGQNTLRFNFTQNINPRWNAGFNIQRMTSDLQFGDDPTSSTGGSSTRLAENWAFVIHSNYQSKNDKYTLLFQYNNMNHRVLNQGGLLIDPDTVQASTFAYDGNQILANARTRERKNAFHVYHQYVLDQAFQVYNVIDFQNRYYVYNDNALASNFAFYHPTTALLDSARIRQEVRYQLLENQFGLKGRFSRGNNPNSAFNYRAWIRQRIYGMEGLYNIGALQPNRSYRINRFENFLGGWLGYYFPDSLTRVTAEAEYLVGRDFRLHGRLESRLLTAGYESVFASPTLLQNRFISNVVEWENNFGLRGTQHAYGQLNLRLGSVTLQPGVDYYLLNNYVYFDTASRPRQLSSAFSVVRTGLGWQWKLGRFTTLGQAYYTLVSRDDVLRIPKLFANARLEYDFLLFKKLFILAGVELHYKSTYYADQYMPLTEQYHIQNEFRVNEYVVADAFANFRINRVRLFVKLAHANQGVGDQIYYVAPYYPGMRRSFAFGVHWLLFD